MQLINNLWNSNNDGLSLIRTLFFEINKIILVKAYSFKFRLYYLKFSKSKYKIKKKISIFKEFLLV